jgi:hypothetical protein
VPTAGVPVIVCTLTRYTASNRGPSPRRDEIGARATRRANRC